ncbi:MAG TPA: hypothetical protein VF570_10550 [Pyrinomonadaceae bacterium]
MFGAACASDGDDGGGSVRERWQVSIGFRKQRSHRHFVGTVEQKNREREGTEIVNDVYLWDLGLTYNFTPRTSLSVSVPVQHATRVSPARFNAAGVQTSPKAVSHGIGVGDMSVGAKVWLLDPGREDRPRQNIAFGFGVKLPTGNEGVTDTVDSATGPRLVVVDQSIQLGDGGFGVALSTDMYKRLWKTTLYGNGIYLFNPRNTNGVRTGRGRASEAIMSVADQYLARAGVVVPIPKVGGWSASFGARLEGIPVRDAFGKSDGFRRPGYALSLEPGVNWLRSRGREMWSASVAVPVERNRRVSISDMQDHRHGDAAFADYVLVLGYARRF